MQDLVKTLVEHILSWPVAAVILAWIFKTPLKSLIDRIDLFKGPAGIEVSTPLDSATKQLKTEKASPTDGQLTVPGDQSQPNLPLPEDIAAKRRLVESYGGDEKPVLLQIAQIESSLKDLQYSFDSENTVHLLIRQLAVVQLLHHAECVYRLIFGSQIALMRKLNESGPQPESVVRPFYERARTESPVFYGDYTFENWIAFLIGQQVVVLQNSNYGLTWFGQEFLGWLVFQSVPAKPN